MSFFGKGALGQSYAIVTCLNVWSFVIGKHCYCASITEKVMNKHKKAKECDRGQNGRSRTRSVVVYFRIV